MSNKIPTIQEWKTENPNKMLNEYYAAYGRELSKSVEKKDPEVFESNLKISKKWLWATIIIIAIASSLFLLNGKIEFNFQILNKATVSLSKEKNEIKNIIETVYFDICNGVYAPQIIQGRPPENLPFYNGDLSTLAKMKLVPLIFMEQGINMYPRDIQIKDLKEHTANVSYTLIISMKGKEMPNLIEMLAKKIGGNWKLDGHKILPFDEMDV